MIFNMHHGPLDEASKAMKASYVEALSGGMSLHTCLSMCVKTADWNDADDDLILQNLVLLLAAWAEVRGEPITRIDT